MKNKNRTIEDLVSVLNRNNKDKDFYVDDFANIGICVINETYNGETHQLVQFNQNDKTWHTMALFGLENSKVQKDIMDFIYATNNNYWFDKMDKKYNIIIGRDVDEHITNRWITVYAKTSTGVEIEDSVREDDLMEDEFIFTESEVKELQSELPENMAEIVELGKVEIKDEYN